MIYKLIKYYDQVKNRKDQNFLQSSIYRFLNVSARKTGLRPTRSKKMKFNIVNKIELRYLRKGNCERSITRSVMR